MEHGSPGTSTSPESRVRRVGGHDLLAQQRLSDATTTHAVRNVHGVLGNPAVAVTLGNRTQRSPSDNNTPDSRHPSMLRQPPFVEMLTRGDLSGKGGISGVDTLAVNTANRIPVVVDHGPDTDIVGQITRAARTRSKDSHHHIRRLRQGNATRRTHRDDRARPFLTHGHKTHIGELAQVVRHRRLPDPQRLGERSDGNTTDRARYPVKQSDAHRLGKAGEPLRVGIGIALREDGRTDLIRVRISDSHRRSLQRSHLSTISTAVDGCLH